ncbi:hypothetical protein [Odoribacter laneus]|uniref:hypothetical protein n=1 Tax=Odoribacter laneus TaxID=626933 RepID=UPI002658138E|nr:hypothetical protein [Odoribacter laneus]
MKTSRIDLPSSLGKGNESLIRGKNRARVQLEGEGYTLREWRFPIVIHWPKTRIT